MKRNIRKIWTKYDKLALLSEEKQKVGLRDCFAELDKLSEGEKDDEYYYLKGFLHYMSEPSEHNQAQECFQKSLEINPIDGHARLYLGYSLYDIGFYKESEYHFSLVDKDEFGSLVRDQIQLNVEEMLVCCQVKISNLDDQSLLEAKKLINKSRNLDELDSYLSNLANALKGFGVNIDELAISNLNFRPATIKDLPEIVRMLADDFLGKQRERYEEPLPESYLKAFAEIDSSPNNELIVAVMSEPSALAGGLPESNPKDEIVIGTMQLTFIPNIAFQGGKRMLIESVRVDSELRGQGIGKKFMEFAINRAKEKDCLFVQLTTAADRTDAHRFYKDLGFTASHVGMKLKLR